MIFLFLCLTSLIMTFSRLIHVAANGIVSFFLMAEWYSIVYIHHLFFIHPSIDGHLGGWWLLCLGYCKQCYNEHWGACTLLDHALSSYMPGSEQLYF